MKVVFDTNILVSALAFPGGHADIALRRIIEETGFTFSSPMNCRASLRAKSREMAKNWRT